MCTMLDQRRLFIYTQENERILKVKMKTPYFWKFTIWLIEILQAYHVKDVNISCNKSSMIHVVGLVIVYNGININHKASSAKILLHY